jgi:hypothetical protein
MCCVVVVFTLEKFNFNHIKDNCIELHSIHGRLFLEVSLSFKTNVGLNRSFVIIMSSSFFWLKFKIIRSFIPKIT